MVLRTFGNKSFVRFGDVCLLCVNLAPINTGYNSQAFRVEWFLRLLDGLCVHVL